MVLKSILYLQLFLIKVSLFFDDTKTIEEIYSALQRRFFEESVL